MFPPQELPLPGELLLITDELASPADFLLHRFLAAHLKKGPPFRSVVLSVSGDMARWKAVAGRSNLNLAQCIDSRSLVFVDVASELGPSLSADSSANSSLRTLFDTLRSLLDEGADVRPLVILDDIATLEWIGVPLLELVRLSRAICALCRKTHAALIVRHHVVTPGEPDDLLRHLLQLCTYHMDVLPLSSGRSGSVSGQVALHAGPAAVDSPFKLIPRSVAVHYRLTDTGSIFFDRGTGGGVL